MQQERMIKFVSMKPLKFTPGPFLMIVTLIAVTGFQAYWLRNNYNNAKRNLEIQTNVTFHETVRGQHIKTLRLNYALTPDEADHAGQKMIFLEKHSKPLNEPGNAHEEEIITTVNALRNKIPDSLHINNVIITSGLDSAYRDSNLSKVLYRGQFRGIDTGERVIKLELNLDSLKDTLQLPKVINAYSQALKVQGVDVPFSIIKLPKVLPGGDEAMSMVTVGLAHPVTYQLQLGNTFPFLVKKIMWPIIFSIFLVGITIISFLILYRNLLRQRRLAAIKNEFISNITHELKTPIATVGVAIEALKNFNAIHDPQRTKEYLDISPNELQRLSLLVDKVLKLSMFEKKEIELKNERYRTWRTLCR